MFLAETLRNRKGRNSAFNSSTHLILIRLNNQHEFIKAACDGHVLLPPTPKESILNVADIACGTGIWLQDVASELSIIPTSNGQKRHFHGFDISDAQFPAKRGENMDFSIHDVLQPFPREEQGKYDVVQVRLLLLALKEVDISTAVQNVVQLLRE
jgi:SAM-dependent methyltransferase